MAVAGVFMDSTIKGNYAIHSMDANSLSDLRDNITCKFPDATHSAIQLFYSVGSLENCILETLDEFETMLMIAAMFTPPIVKIQVHFDNNQTQIPDDPIQNEFLSTIPQCCSHGRH